MNACPPSRTAKLLLTILTVILTAAGQVGRSAAADVPVLTLPPVKAYALCRVPPPKSPGSGRVKDSATTVDKAAN
jgi:hypothetical protein